jgi:glycosyltransferase involved in cell wall biosynthesis
MQARWLDSTVLTNGPKASVVVCTYDEARTRDLEECVASLLKQKVHPLELVVVVDHNHRLYEYLSGKYRDPRIKVVLNDSQNTGQASSMNYGIKTSLAPIICFIDDDSVADEDWLLTIMDAYDDETVSVGGRIEPLWIGEKPTYLPEEFYWLIGSTGSFLLDSDDQVRNLWSSNISYKAKVFAEVGLFSESLGRFGDPLFQGEDTEFALRVIKVTGKRARYRPNAIVYHRIRPDRLRLRSLLERAYLQGYAKAYISRLHRELGTLSVEKDYLQRLLVSGCAKLPKVALGPERICGFEQLAFTVSAVAIVLFGYVVGLNAAR